MNVQAQKTFHEMISLETMSTGAWQQDIHGWAKDSDNVWKYHFDLDRTTDLSFDLSIGLKRSSSSDNFHMASVYVVLSHPTISSQYQVISPELIFTPNDWATTGASGNYSRNKSVTVTIPHELFDSYDFPQDYRVSVIISGKLGISEPFGVHKNYFQEKYVNYVIKPIVKGPDAICTEGIYKAHYASAVTLENATGIATLTDLGNGQWKVTKTGNGNVIIKATNGNKSTNKSIAIGSPTSKNLIDNSNTQKLQPNTVYYFQLEDGFIINSYNWSVIGGTIISGQSSSVVAIRTDPNPYQGDNNFSITLEHTGTCGSGIVNATRWVAPGDGDIPDPGEIL